MTRLQMVVPVYVMFTKCDLVAGFVEFWGDLAKSKRAQIWGATFPLEGAESRDAGKAFEEEFDQLVEALHSRAIKRIGAEREWDNRQKIFQFPIEYQSLKNNLSEFINGLFTKGNFQEAPIFRGVYFTSGTQEGKPMDRVMGGMLKAFNIAPPAAAAAEPQGESKSYFVTDMFRKVVFPDQFVAGRTKAEVRRQLLNRLAFAGVAMFLAALLLLPALYTFGNNNTLVATVKTAVLEAKKAPPTPLVKATGDGSLDKLEALRALVQNELSSDPNFLKYGWGMYTGEELRESAKKVYLEEMYRIFRDPVKAKLDKQLTSIFDKNKMSASDYSTYFNALKLYLEACDGNPEHRTQSETNTWFNLQLKSYWDDNPPSPESPLANRYEELTALHLRSFINLMNEKVGAGATAGPFWACDDQNIVAPVRKFLTGLGDDDEADYLRLTALAPAPRAITLSDIILGSPFGNYVSTSKKPERQVRGLYTKDGWNRIKDRFVRANVDKQVAQDAWVLGDKQNVQELINRRVSFLERYKARYFEEYNNEWALFLKQIDVATPEGKQAAQLNANALEELRALVSAPRAYDRLLGILKENTVLEDAPEPEAEAKGLLGRAGDAIERKAKNDVANSRTGQALGVDAGAQGPGAPPPRKILPPEERWAALWSFGEGGKDSELSKYYDGVIGKLVGSLTRMREEKGKGVTLTQVDNDFRGAMDAINNELATSRQTVTTEEILSPLLKNPVNLGYANVLTTLGGGAEGKWQAQVFDKWEKLYQDKYPFTDSVHDITLADYTKFFKPHDGILWKFYDTNLKGMLDLDGDDFVEAEFGSKGYSIPFTKRFLRCFQDGLEITRTTFPSEKSEAPLVEFAVNLHSVSENVSEVTFSIDGAERVYKNWPEEWLDVQWPAKEPKQRGGRIHIKGLDSLDEDITRLGEFGFFRLIDAASKIEAGTEGGKKGGAPVIVVTWNLQSLNGQVGVVKMDIRPVQADNVFLQHLERRQRLFRGYRCPRVMCAGCEVSKR